MVKLEEVLDDSFKESQPSHAEVEEDWDTDGESDSSSDESTSFPSSHQRSTRDDLDDDDDDVENESLGERIYALRDMVPPLARRKLSHTFAQSKGYVASTLAWSGSALWLLSTSVLLLGVPFALAYLEDAELEGQMKMQREREVMLGEQNAL